jgi:hypothetical protein
LLQQGTIGSDGQPSAMHVPPIGWQLPMPSQIPLLHVSPDPFGFVKHWP